MKKVAIALSIIFVLVLGLTLALLLRKPQVKITNTTKIATPSATLNPQSSGVKQGTSSNPVQPNQSQQPDWSQSTTVINEAPKAQPTSAPAPTSKPIIDIHLPPIIPPVLSL